MVFNVRIVIKMLSLLLVINSIFLLIPLFYSIYAQDGTVQHFVLTFFINLGLGLLGYFANKKVPGSDLRRREGFIAVTFGWIVLTFAGTLPYILSGAITEYSNVFFETMSGYTATGASILENIEELPETILLWRSVTQWIGGMGIIVLAIAVLPILGFGSMRLFSAEAPGISPDKITPRITQTAKRLWIIYLALTFVVVVALKLAGMNWFDSFNHALTTIATGGFSTKQASIGFFNSPLIEYIIILFMILGGTNFILIYYMVKGRFLNVFRNEEWRFYISILFVFAIFCAIVLYQFQEMGIEESFRKGLFQVVTIVTTTGYVTGDYNMWGNTIVMMLFLLMFVGGSAGSTSGGVKVIRHLVLVKNSFTELRRQMHLNAVIPVRVNGNSLTKEVTSMVLAFIMIYVLIFVFSAIVLSITGLDYITALGAVAATLGNVGPGIGDVGPASSYLSLTPFAKWFTSFLMLLGRLELFTIMVLFTPYFWIKR